MLNRRFALALPAAALMTLCPSVNAGPPDPALLPPHASFVFHYDVDGFVNSVIGQTVPTDMADGSTFFDEQTIWRQISTTIDFKLFDDLKSLTLFNSGEVSDDTIGVAVMTDKIDQLFESLPTILSSHRLSTIDGHDVHSWTEIVEEKRHHWYAHVRPTGSNMRLCIVGRNWEQVLDTIERVAAPQPERALPSVMLQPPGLGSIVYVAAAKLDMFDAEAEWFSQIARTLEGVSIDLREHENNLILNGILRSTREEEAATMSQMLQGLVAMARLAVAQDPDPDMQVVRETLRQVRITTEKQTVTLQLVLPLDRAIEAIRMSQAAPLVQMGDRDLRIGITRPADANQPEQTDAMNPEKARDRPE